MNQITKIRLPSGTEVALVDWTDKPLFSTGDFGSGFTQQETDLFGYVVGDQVPAVNDGVAITARRTATEMDTNVQTPGAMASTEEMLVYAIKIEYFNLDLSNAADFTTGAASIAGQPMPSIVQLAQFARYCTLRLYISQKIYAEAGLGYFNTGFGPAGTATTRTADATGRSYATMGVSGAHAVRSYVVPHHIGGQEKYRVSICNFSGGGATWAITEIAPNEAADDASQVMRMRVYLEGLRKRPVS